MKPNGAKTYAKVPTHYIYATKVLKIRGFEPTRCRKRSLFI